MAWTAPMTAVAGSVFTASQFNTTIRDNMLECETSRAQTVSGYSVVTGMNQLIERVAAQNGIGAVTDTTTSTEYVDLDGTPGPSVSVQTGDRAIVSIYGTGATSGGTAAWMSWAVSGASQIDASDSLAVQMHVTTPDSWRAGLVFGQQGLTPGLNTFSMKYRVSTSGTGTFACQQISVIPF